MRTQLYEFHSIGHKPIVLKSSPATEYHALISCASSTICSILCIHFLPSPNSKAEQSTYMCIHPSIQRSNSFTMPLLYILLGLLLFSSLRAPSCSSATTANDSLAAGQALVVGDKLVSRNGKFALGFFQPAASIIASKSDNTTSFNSNWYLGIWFNQIPVFTTVWVANRDEPIPDSKLNLTRLKISSDGNLAVIVAHAGTESSIWSTHIANRTRTSINSTSAVLLNSGNLALVETPSSKVLLWQSFDYPADIALSGSKFGRNKLTGLNRRLISKKSLVDPGLGSYSIELGTSGMVLQRNNPSIVYWSWASGASTSKLIPILNSILEYDARTKGLFNLTYVDNSVEEYYMYALPNDTYSVVTQLDISGQIKLNIWSQAEQSWQNLYTQPVSPCSAPATCGPFTVCNNRATPFCDCMESFSQKSPHDWQFDDRTGGCIRDTPLHCTGNGSTASSTDMFHPIAKVQLPISPQSTDIATTQSKCEEACLNSCSCTAYSYNNSRCSVWHGELFSANLNDGVDINSEDALYIRLAAKDLPNHLSANQYMDSCYEPPRVTRASTMRVCTGWKIEVKGGAPLTMHQI